MRYLAFFSLAALVSVLAACDPPALTATFWSPAERKEQAARELRQGLQSLGRDEERADHQLRQAANLLGTEHQGYVYVAQRLLEEGKADKAGLLLEEAAAQPAYRNNPFVFAVLADASWSKGDKKQAAALEKRAQDLVRDAEQLLSQPAPTREVERQERVQRLLLNGSFVLQRLKDPGRAVALLRKAVALNPGEMQNLTRVDALALSGLGLALAEHPSLGDDARHGLRLTRLAAQSHLESASLRHAYGWALARQGENDGAQRVLREAADMDPSDPETRFHLGQVYAALGKRLAAKREFESALQLRPHHRGAEAALQSLGL